MPNAQPSPLDRITTLTHPAPLLHRLIPTRTGRGFLWLGFYLTIILSWVAVAMMAGQRPGADYASVPAEFWANLCLSAAEANPVSLWAMWALMSSAMMLPTFTPALTTFVNLSDAGATGRGGAAALVSGYGAVWLAASALGAAAQWALSKAGLLLADGQSGSSGLSALLMLGAGAYQFSRVKDACLARCRMPLTFFMERWRPGNQAAFAMGAELGAICFGCCWALMALGFVGGTMNLIWMGVATLLMTLEKLPDIGRHLTRPVGIALIAAAGVTTFEAIGFL